ncbi:NapC/NirT family cytochrome c [Holophaga foetida]|uniref:NapC/NirT family cytochrome c n=1 Tax=Holophaga foetida TaxID=35839 RepID=UPI00024750D9|nr:NapC/NirT family cytochrome c [Holophaga foetida]
MSPFPWKALAALASGLAFGLGLWFLRSDYVGDGSASCRSCHTMNEALASWRAGAHHQQDCGECHLPQGPFPRTWAKGVDGLHHATVHAFRREGIYHRLASPAVVEANCRRCHQSSPRMHPLSSRPCLDCHGDTAHGAPALARR